jgi:beta-lactamase class A
MLALLYGTRLMIMGIGVGVIAGTALSVWDPANRVTADSSTKPQPQQSASPKPSTPTLELTQELTPLKSELQRLMAQSPDLSAGLMVVDLDNGEFLDFNAGNVIPAASTIKFPLLVAFFQDVDAGKIRLDEMLTMRKDLIATEAGDLQDQPPGSQFSALEVASKMITISDNTATNMILDRLGGKAAVNQRFQSWGLAQTQIGDWLPDLKGTNTTSPKDMATLLGVVTKGQLVSLRSLDLMLQMMRSVENTAMLPQGLGQGAKIAHKTGNIGSVVGDVGLVDMPSGKRYLITALVKRPHGDERAISLVQQLSKTTYQYFDRASGKPVSAPGGLPPARPDGIAAPTTPLPSPTDSQGAAPLPKTKIAQP